MTTKYFNVKNGLSAGNITLDASSGNISTTNISVTDISNLGNVGNVKITGGTNGYVLQTDGSGNLSWAVQGGGGGGTPGGSNTQVQYNNIGAFGGSVGFTYDNTSNTLSVPNIQVNSLSNLGNISNVIITGGTSGYVLQTNGSGNLSWTAPGGGTDTGQMPYYIPSGTTYTVQENRQGLFSIPITVDGDLVVNGILVQV